MGDLNIGKIMSEIHESFEIQKSVLRSFKSEKKLVNFIKKMNDKEKKLIIKTSYKDPLGSEFLRRIYTENTPRNLVLESHLFIENFLDKIIKEKFSKSHHILNDSRFTFYLKLQILRSKNYVDSKLYGDILHFNELRNKFVHDLFYDISKFDMTKFHYCDGFYKNIKIKSNDTKREVNLHILKIVLSNLLYRITSKHSYISELKISK